MKLNQERIKIITIIRVVKTVGNFGLSEPTNLWGAAGVNEKGGMDDTTFEKYIINLSIAIFPYAKDLSVLKVLVNIDIGPGRSNFNLLEILRLCGYCLYPEVPNSTSVSQEIDRNCSIFKTYRENLLKFSSDQ